MMRKVKEVQEIIELINKKETFLAKFEFSWDYPCKAIHPYIEEISRLNPELTVITIDISKTGDTLPLLNKLGVKSVPTLIYFEKGKKKRSLLGTKSKKEIFSLLGE